jgi:hypothetical protein
MSKVAELAYDIEQLYIEGYSPKTIAAMLECPMTLVYDWLESNSVAEDKVDPEEWDVAFPPQNNEDYYGA